jgi:mannose/cellobiose epimerase-like protein (N-acyl-D-glucosamine 2-epimerase family)
LVDFLHDVGPPSQRRILLGRHCRWSLLAGHRSSSDLRQWWVQFEAMHTLHILSRHESASCEARAKYLQAYEESWSFVRDRFCDDRYFAGS